MSDGDLAMLWPDDLGWPQHIGVLAVLDGESLFDASGRLRIEDLRERLAARLDLLPRFRQRLHRPGFGRGRPYWADDPSFDIEHHVGVEDVPAPGNEDRLLTAVELLRRRPFDLARPLWEFWFLTGLSDGRVALYVKIHHTFVDGIAGVAALGAFLDSDPNPNLPTRSPWRPDPEPTTQELFIDHLTGMWRGFTSTTRRLRHPVEMLRRFRSSVTAIGRILSEARAPRTSLNHSIGDRRRVALVRTELSAIKLAGRSVGGTVNDVLLTAIAGGVRSLLASRGESTKGLRPRAVVPMAGDAGAGTGNTTASGMIVELPVGESDARRRMQAVSRETTFKKEHPLSYEDAGVLTWPALQRMSARLAGRQRVSNVYVANVPGPASAFYLGTARILELFPLVALVGNVTLGIGGLSYAGQFNITAVADHDSCPDLDVFVEGVCRTLDELSVSHERIERLKL